MSDELMSISPPAQSACQSYVQELCNHPPKGSVLDPRKVVDYCSNSLPDDILSPAMPQSSLVAKYIQGMNFVEAQKRQMGGKSFCQQFWIKLPEAKKIEEPEIIEQPESDRVMLPLMVGYAAFAGIIMLLMPESIPFAVLAAL